MKMIFCDVKGCKEEAFYEIDVCIGWLESSNNTVYKPFEKPTIRKRDLCSDHYKQWCIATYNAFDPIVKKVDAKKK